MTWSSLRLGPTSLTAAFLTALAFFVACGSEPEEAPCGQLPDPHGCPMLRGASCNDRLCGSLYQCVDGQWQLVETCSNTPQDAGNTPDGCTTVTIDRTGETSGCTPDLQNPDCPAAAAEQCAASVCQSECIDFFLCTKDGWKVVAYCNEQGELIVMQ